MATTIKQKVGRPGFKPTAAHNKKVKLLAGRGLNQEDVAAAVGCSYPTFKKYFASIYSDAFRSRKPEFEKTRELAERVVRYIACGMKDSAIAVVIGCSAAVLQKLFPQELHDGRARYEAELIDMLHKSAHAGSNSAIRQLCDRVLITPEKTAAPAKQKPLGKKVVAERLATEPPPVDSGWDELMKPVTPVTRPN